MIQLSLKKQSVAYNIPEDIRRLFSKPVLFYLGHKKDKNNALVSFALFNVQKGVIDYFHSYTQENKNRIEASSLKDMCKVPYHYNPHSVVTLKDGSLLVFTDMCPFAYRVYRDINKVDLIFAQDLVPEFEGEVETLSPTVYTTEDGNYFYFSILRKEKGRKDVFFYKMDTALKKAEYLFDIDAQINPHTIREYKGNLLYSFFNQVMYKFKEGGDVNFRQVYRYILTELFIEYSNTVHEIFTDQAFKKAVKISGMEYSLSDDFAYYLEKKYGTRNVVQIAFLDERFTFTTTSGRIVSYNLKTDIQHRYWSHTATPGHFEVDAKTDCVYVSSHNFGTFENIYVLGNPAIEKYKILSNGKLEKLGIFTHKQGYRFGSHIVFYYKDYPYIVTIGHPNKIFFADGETMEYLYHDDIDGHYEVRHPFILKIKEDDNVIKGLEVSDDGSIVILLGFKYIYFYSFVEKRLVHKVDYLVDDQCGEVNLKDFYKRTTHCQYV